MEDYNVLIRTKKAEVERVGKNKEKIREIMEDIKEIENSLINELKVLLPKLIKPFEEKIKRKEEIEENMVFFSNRGYLFLHSLLKVWLVNFTKENNIRYLQISLLKKSYQDGFIFPDSIVIDDGEKFKDTDNLSEEGLMILFNDKEFLKGWHSRDDRKN